jgi:hypothetical protein
MADKVVKRTLPEINSYLFFCLILTRDAFTVKKMEGIGRTAPQNQTGLTVVGRISEAHPAKQLDR